MDLRTGETCTREKKVRERSWVQSELLVGHPEEGEYLTIIHPTNHHARARRASDLGISFVARGHEQRQSVQGGGGLPRAGAAKNWSR